MPVSFPSSQSVDRSADMMVAIGRMASVQDIALSIRKQFTFGTAQVPNNETHQARQDSDEECRGLRPAACWILGIKPSSKC